jgi:hypothetical protein
MVGAREKCPCDSISGRIRTDKTKVVSVPSVAKVASSTATTETDKTAANASAAQSDTVTGVNLLGGLVTAASVTSNASVTGTPDSTSASTAGSSFSGLVVAGKAIDPSTPYGTILDLPGVGTLTVREAHVHHDANSATASMVGLRVRVTVANTFGLPIGAKVTVGEAKAEFDRTQPVARLQGRASGVSAYGTEDSSAASSARAVSTVEIPSCAGTDGQTLTQTAAAITIAGSVTVAGSTSTAFGGTVGAAQVAQTETQVSGISLLGGLVSASALTAEATESRTGSVSTGSTAGTTFSSLVVAGVTLPPLVAPNTKIALLGIGYVTLNNQEIGKITTTASGIEVVVNTPNLLGFPVGEKITVGQAVATAAAFH